MLVSGSVIHECDILPSDFERMSKSELHNLANSHSIPFERRTTVSVLRDLILNHVLSAQCLRHIQTAGLQNSAHGCSHALRVHLSNGTHSDETAFIVACLSNFATRMSLKTLRCVLHLLQVPFDASDSLNQLH